MRQRGRKSAAALTIVSDNPVRSVTPPANMPDDQKEIWHSIVETMPADWFGKENVALLEQYCVHVCRAKMLGQLVNELTIKPDRTSGETSRMLELMRQEHRQSRLIASLATKMRIAQQSTYDKSARKRKSKSSTVVGGAKPWAAEVTTEEEDDAD